jgi:hypothetical protein
VNFSASGHSIIATDQENLAANRNTDQLCPPRSTPASIIISAREASREISGARFFRCGLPAERTGRALSADLHPEMLQITNDLQIRALELTPGQQSPLPLDIPRVLTIRKHLPKRGWRAEMS